MTLDPAMAARWSVAMVTSAEPGRCRWRLTNTGRLPAYAVKGHATVWSVLNKELPGLDVGEWEEVGAGDAVDFEIESKVQLGYARVCVTWHTEPDAGDAELSWRHSLPVEQPPAA